LVAAQKGPLIYSGSFYGELKAKTSEAIHAPELSGVEFLTVDTVLADGTEVKKGDVVLSFVKGPLEDELRAKETDLAVAEAEMEKSRLDLERERIELELDVKRKNMAVQRAQLYVVEGVNLISALELAKYKLDVSKAEIELDLARQALRNFGSKRASALEVQRLKVESEQRQVDEKRENLGHMEVKAPADGVLYGPYTRLNWVRGKVAEGSVCRPGDKLLEIPDLGAYEAQVFVRQRDSALIKVDSVGTVYPTATGAKSFKGKVVKKEDFATTRNERMGTESADGSLKEIQVVMAIEGLDQAMRPGGTLRANISATLVEDALRIPIAAVDESSGEPVVTLEGGTTRKVELGESTTTHVQVLSGLEEGDLLEVR
jgi:multidrug efflux pump subunit AcrA (membrane-fusion protein)